IEKAVNSKELFAAAAKSRIRVKDLAGIVFVENAVAGEIFHSGIAPLIVVEGGSRGHVFGFKGNIEVIVEIIVVGRDPGEVPVHALADSFYFVDGRTGYRSVRDVMIFEMIEDTFDVVDFKRAPDALLFLAGSHHEMFDEELAAAIEKLRERDFS